LILKKIKNKNVVLTKAIFQKLKNKENIFRQSFSVTNSDKTKKILMK
jgi:hypothetical protein